MRHLCVWAQADERTNYSAIWVFKPCERTLQVFKQFEVSQELKQFEVKEELGATKKSGTASLTLVEPPGGYKALVRIVLLNPVPDDDEESVEMEQDEFSGATAEHKAGTVRSNTEYDAATSRCVEDVSTDVCMSPSMSSCRSFIVTMYYS